jgi:hypothetical protein
MCAHRWIETNQSNIDGKSTFVEAVVRAQGIARDESRIDAP